MSADGQELNAALHLASAYGLAVLIFDELSQSSVAAVYVTDIDEAIKVDEQSGNLSHQAQRHVTISGGNKSGNGIEVGDDGIEPKPLFPLAIRLRNASLLATSAARLEPPKILSISVIALAAF